MQACLTRLGLELYHIEGSSLYPKVCMIMTEVTNTLLFILLLLDVDAECTTRRQAPIGAWPSPPAGHCLQAPTSMGTAKPVREGPQADTMRQHRNGNNPVEWCSRRWLEGEGRILGGLKNTWRKYLVGDLDVFRATEGYVAHFSLVFLSNDRDVGCRRQ